MYGINIYRLLCNIKIYFSPCSFDHFLFWWDNLINIDHDKNTFGIWVFGNSVDFSCCCVYRNKAFVKLNMTFYQNSIFMLFFKILISEDDIRPTLINAVVSINKNGTQNKYLPILKSFLCWWHTILVILNS